MQSSWEKLNKFEAQEWENLAFEKCDMIGETFLAHYFEPRMCLSCFNISEFSILRTRKDLPDYTYDIKERKWCTACGHFHAIEKRNSGARRYNDIRSKRR